MVTASLFLSASLFSSTATSTPSYSLVQSVRLSEFYASPVPTSSKAASYTLQKGRWDPSGSSGVICIHTALLPDSRLLCFERPHMPPVSFRRVCEESWSSLTLFQFNPKVSCQSKHQRRIVDPNRFARHSQNRRLMDSKVYSHWYTKQSILRWAFTAIWWIYSCCRRRQSICACC